MPLVKYLESYGETTAKEIFFYYCYTLAALFKKTPPQKLSLEFIEKKTSEQPDTNYSFLINQLRVITNICWWQKNTESAIEGSSGKKGVLE